MNIVDLAPIYQERVYWSDYSHREFFDQVRLNPHLPFLGCYGFFRVAKTFYSNIPEETYKHHYDQPVVARARVHENIIKCFMQWTDWQYCTVKVFKKKIVLEFVWEDYSDPGIGRGYRVAIGTLKPCYYTWAA